MAKIDFEAKTDRELNILTAQTVNGISEHLIKINGTLLKHEIRLVNLESGKTYCGPMKSSKGKFVDTVSKNGAFAILGSLIAGVIYAFGCSIGWW